MNDSTDDKTPLSVREKKYARDAKKIIEYYRRHTPETDTARQTLEKAESFMALYEKNKALKQEADFISKKMCFLITDKKYVLEACPNLWTAIRKYFYLNYLITLQQSKIRVFNFKYSKRLVYNNRLVNEEVLLIRGSRKASAFVGMSEDEFVAAALHKVTEKKPQE